MIAQEIQAAIYARVSSQRQAEENTIESQLEDLSQRAAADGHELTEEMIFADGGYSGSTLVRPALERLRDLVAAGTVDRLYVHSPDRLARKYAYQVLLVDEFRHSGIEVVFLNRELAQTPEDDLLLQVQGMVAEYERAKIIERNRRGKRHAARIGSVNVLGGAPYGYRYVTKSEGGGVARYEVIAEEARLVRQIFDWVGKERLSIGEVSRRLTQAKEPTRRGKTSWDRSVIWGMLGNPAYKGEAAFGKTRYGPLRPKLRAQRGRPLQPKRPYSHYDVDQEDWVSIAVPPIVEPELFEAVQEQLQENKLHARERQRGAKYLLQGLVVCNCCGYAYYGKGVSPSARKGKAREYAYYRCLGTDAYRFGGQRICSNKQVRTDLLDLAVWKEVRNLLENPERLAEEYRRRQRPHSGARDQERRAVEARLKKLRQGLARLIDSYAEGLIEKGEFEPRVGSFRERIAKLEEQSQQLADEESLQAELRLIIGRLEEFCERMRNGLDEADWSSRRDLIRTLVKRVEVEQDKVNVVFRVDQNPFDSEPDGAVLQHRWRRNNPPLR